MTERFREELNAQATPWIELDGRNRQQRLSMAISAIDDIVLS
jgi:hypothetical protein